MPNRESWHVFRSTTSYITIKFGYYLNLLRRLAWQTSHNAKLSFRLTRSGRTSSPLRPIGYAIQTFYPITACIPRSCSLMFTTSFYWRYQKRFMNSSLTLASMTIVSAHVCVCARLCTIVSVSRGFVTLHFHNFFSQLALPTLFHIHLYLVLEVQLGFELSDSACRYELFIPPRLPFSSFDHLVKGVNTNSNSASKL